jgi:uncharacterized protein
VILRYLRWCQRARWAVLVGGFLTFVAGSVVASRLQLRTAFSELLPSNDPGVAALERTQRRMGDLSLLLIGVSSPDREANLRYAEVLTKRLRALPPNVCALAAYHLRETKDFLEKNRWLYLSEADLTAIRDRIKREIALRKNPLLIDLGEDETIAQLRERLTTKDPLSDKFKDGYFTQGAGQFVWIAALPPGGLFVEGGGETLLREAERLIAAAPPGAYHPQMRVHVGGPIATGIANRKAIERDILWVTVTCLTLVAASIALYFRRFRAVLLAGIPATLGTTLAFAFATGAYGYLNSSTAFLGSIIVGNGINYAIVLMARYEEERANGHATFEALATAVAAVWKGTLVAALSAAVAYGALVVTSFRGFSQFGVIGGVGWLLCWTSTFLLLPPLLLVLDGGTRKVKPRAPARLGWLGKLVSRRPRAVLVASVALTVITLYGSRHFLRDPFEYDFRKLNTNTSSTAEAERFNRNMDDLFGRWPSPTVILTDSLDDVELAKRAIRRQDGLAGGGEVIGQITTIFDVLPGTAEVQRRRLTLIEDIRRLAADPALEILDEAERKQLADATPPGDLRVLAPADLPPLARRPFTEADGTVGKVLLVYPVEEGLSVWDGRALLRIAAVLQYLRLEDGRTLSTSGSAVIFGAMIRSILRDGPIATLTALITVVLTVMFTMRPWRAAALALGTLGVGVVWMVGAAGWAGVRITFLNFIALPITLGLGIEYAVNVLSRYREKGNVLEAISATGGAVALCSWTTIVGYGSLLAAQNQALRGFGAMAILSEVSCLLAAIVALPAFLLSRQR